MSCRSRAAGPRWAAGAKGSCVLCCRLVAGPQPPHHGGTGHPARGRRLHRNRQRVLQRGRPQQVGADRQGRGVPGERLGLGRAGGAGEALGGMGRGTEGDVGSGCPGAGQGWGAPFKSASAGGREVRTWCEESRRAAREGWQGGCTFPPRALPKMGWHSNRNLEGFPTYVLKASNR